jgi:DinB superfamily
MANQDGRQIARIVRMKMEEFGKTCEVLDEETASRAPQGRWTPKQIISHLCGPAETGHLPSLKAFLEEETPRIDIKTENPFWSGKRTDMTLKELLIEFDREYTAIARFVEELSEEQLSRKAHIPMLKESPLGEYPTLAQWVIGLSDFHIGFHIDHMKEIIHALGIQNKQ